MLARAAPLARASASAATRGLATAADTHSFALKTPLKYHLMEDAKVTHASTSKEELMAWFRHMYTIRRMEISCDTEYKVRPPHPQPTRR